MISIEILSIVCVAFMYVLSNYPCQFCLKLGIAPCKYIYILYHTIRSEHLSSTLLIFM